MAATKLPSQPPPCCHSPLSAATLLRLWYALPQPCCLTLQLPLEPAIPRLLPRVVTLRLPGSHFPPRRGYTLRSTPQLACMAGRHTAWRVREVGLDVPCCTDGH